MTEPHRPLDGPSAPGDVGHAGLPDDSPDHSVGPSWQADGPQSAAEAEIGELPAGGGDIDDGAASPAGLGPGRPAGIAGLVAIGLAGVILGGILALAGQAALRPGEATATPSLSPSPSPSVAFVDGPALGDVSAPVTVEIWADYQCPFCRLESAAFGGDLERELALAGTIRVEYHDFAFLGQESIDAAVAARCAGRQAPNTYWRYHDLLFAAQQGENQGAFSRANLVTLANIAGLDVTAFTSCLDDPIVAAAVNAETARGRTLGVSSTPTIRVTGPGGTTMLTGFSGSWAKLTGAIEAVASARPSGAPASGSPSATGAASPTATGSALPGASASGQPGPSGGTATPTASPGASP